MKKTIYLLLAVMMTALFIGCGEESEENTPVAPDKPETPVEPDKPIIIEKEYEIGKQYKITKNIKNPYNTPAYLFINGYADGEIKFISNCGTQVSVDIPTSFDGEYDKNNGCDVIYEYAPTKLAKSVAEIGFTYYTENPRQYCDYIKNPSIKAEEKVKKIESLGGKHERYEYMYYATKGNEKTHRVENINLGKYPYSANDGYYTLPNYKPVIYKLKLKPAIYDIKGYYQTGMFESTDNAVCEIKPKNEGDYESKEQLEIKKEGCELKIVIPKNNTNITFINTKDKNEYYYDIIADVEEVYYFDTKLEIYYGYGYEYQGESKYIDANKITKTTDYLIEGVDASKFKIIPTKYNGCKIEKNQIVLPTGKQECYVIADLIDEVKKGPAKKYSATITYKEENKKTNLYGEISDKTSYLIDDFVSSNCK